MIIVPRAPAARTGHSRSSGQFALLGQRRFGPYFWTQFLGAANDNLLKFALTVMVTYQVQLSWLPPASAGLAIGALYILPFVLLSATSGQLADKYDKRSLMVAVKRMEVFIAAWAGWGFLAGSVPVLLACTFLMGLHSTLFGPAKFAYLPQHLGERELTGGNALVAMGTFVAILLGNVAGGLLVAVPVQGTKYAALACLASAVLGRIACHFVPATPAPRPRSRMRWNVLADTWRTLRCARRQPVVFRSMLGISWMWFFGAAFLGLFPAFAREVLGGDAQVAALLLVVFTLGIGLGSLLCESLGRRQVEIGLVPLGALGMSIFALDLGQVAAALPATAPLGLVEFLGMPVHWRVLADLLLAALFTGLYSVPMYALVQLRTSPQRRSRVIAANNILNALFMVASAVLTGALLHAGLDLPHVFMVLGVATAVVALAILVLVPEYLLRCVAWIATHLMYRFEVRGAHHIPAHGPAILVCNHVSFFDAVLLMAASPRPISFVMYHRYFRTPVLGWLFRLGKAIPVAPRGENAAVYGEAFERAAQVLRSGELLAIFPEGRVTPDGRLQAFKGGVMKILQRAAQDGLEPVVVPMALDNMWGSFFSRIEVRRGHPAAMVRPFRRGLFNRVRLSVGHPVAAAQVQPVLLAQRVAQLLITPEPHGRGLR